MDGPVSFDPFDPMLDMVLQRIRQLAAHETGHTLGLSHNFAASSFPHNDHDETISVMDYPHPYVTLKDGVPDISHAYPVGIGIWDKVAIDYGYREFSPKTDEHTALDKILADSEKTGLTFDPIAAAESSADLTLHVLFDPERATRLVEYHARKPREPSLSDVIQETLNSNRIYPQAPNPAPANDLKQAVAVAVHARIVEWLLALAASPKTSFEARAITRESLVALRGEERGTIAAYAAEAARIDLFLNHPESFTPAKPIEAPPGMPIGTEDIF